MEMLRKPMLILRRQSTHYLVCYQNLDLRLMIRKQGFI